MPTAYSYRRFSSDKQAKGDSLRRQQELAEKFIAEHPELDLDLDTSLSMTDAGFSAYKNLHLRKGDLGVFLHLVDQGEVRPGSYLLVENFDRLSRDTPTKAFQVLTELIEAEIVVVTLNDGREYSKKTMNGEESTLALLTSILSMVRANDESRVKGKRVKAAWTNKFKRIAEGHQITKRVPFWLTPERELIPERVEVVRRIFKMYSEGVGSYLIARTLNYERVQPPTLRAGHWAFSTITKILRSRNVLGILETADGSSHSAYYPSIISEDLWSECQRLRPTGRRTASKPGSALLSGIFVCSHCGSTVRKAVKTGRIRKDGTRNRWETAVCSKAISNGRCVYIGLPYGSIASATLDVLRGLEHVVPENDPVAERIMEVESEISELQDELTIAFDELKRKRTTDIRERYRALADQLDVFRAEITELRASRSAVSYNGQMRALTDIFNSGQVTNANIRKLVKSGVIDFMSRTIQLICHSGVVLDAALDSTKSDVGDAL